jgi:DNA-binding NarL/FixJ family response regulator
MHISIAIADDHPLILQGLQTLLNGQPGLRVTATYRTSQELLEDMTRKQPNILLLDIQMPGKSGMELAAIVTQTYPDTGIIALTNLNGSFYIKSMLNKGVKGYVLKDSDEAILLDAIAAVHKGESYMDPSLRDRAWQDMVRSKKGAQAQQSLTRREKEILRLIASEYTSQEIADKLFLSYRTVETHRTNLILKLGTKNMVGLVKAAIQMGLVE